MPKVLSKEINSISDFAKSIEDVVSSETSNFIWYRGVRNKAFQLMPRLFRDKKREPNTLVDIEGTMATWFHERSIPFCVRELRNDWEKLFFMQHYGVPTRLLDWTENPFIALHFALLPDNENKDADSSVWILNPCKWNKAATIENGSHERIFFKDDDSLILDPYCLRKPNQGGELLPLTLYGTYNSYRIAAQRGVFTVFGSSKTPMENYYTDKNYSFEEDCLSRLVIPCAVKPLLYKSLISLGITESTILPDLDGLARESRRIFGFED